MKASARKQVETFFNRVESRIVAELDLAGSPGVRLSARTAAADRAATLARDLDYLRARYSSAPVMVGEGDAR